MSVQSQFYAFFRGAFDSLKGFYWLFHLDSKQRKARDERSTYQEMRAAKRSNHSPTHQYPKHVDKEEPSLLGRVFQCCLLNGVVFGLSLVAFNYCLLPFLQFILLKLFGSSDSASRSWYWLSIFLNVTFSSLWVIPLYLLSRVVNGLWFQDIGNVAYRYSVGRPKGIPSLSTFIADNLFSFLIQILFMVQAVMVSFIPLTGVNDILFIVHNCLLYSLYSFEYKWVQMGWPLNQRLSFLESNWPYFLGFGLPLTLLTWWPGEFFISGCVFSILFPVFIVSGNEAEPVANIKGVRRLQFFSFVVAISNGLFRQVKKPQPPPPPKMAAQQQPNHLRRPSQPTATATVASQKYMRR